MYIFMFSSTREVSKVMTIIILWLALTSTSADTLDSQVEFSDLVIVVISQNNSYHEKKQNELLYHIRSQHPSSLEVVFSHRRWNDEFDWTYFPILKRIDSEFSSKKWILICEEGTRFHLQFLRLLLDEHDADSKLYIGRLQVDREYSIIHHFDTPGDVSFADAAFGILLSTILLHELATAKVPFEDFDIDAKYTLAEFIKQLTNTTISNSNRLCANDQRDGCAVYFVDEQCEGMVDHSDLLIAVKSCDRFLPTRIPVIKRTWAADAKRILYFSESEDASVPTVPVHVNTERGHCAKFKAILSKLASQADLFKWAFLVDDDTSISVTSLRRMLACYEWNSTTVIGERYGFRAHSGRGYNYPTGGSGIAFSSPAIVKLAKCSFCICPEPGAADDMTLGAWMQALHWPVLHQAGLHQAQPENYHSEYLARVQPITFHKFPVLGEPEDIYKQWFQRMESSERNWQKKQEL